MTDTPDHVHRLYVDFFQRKTVQERFQMGFEMMSSGQKMVRCALHEQHPNLSAAELKAAVFERIYRTDFSAEEMARIKAAMIAFHQPPQP